MTLELVSETSVVQIVDAGMAYAAVRRAFVSLWRGQAQLLPVLAGRGAESGSAVNVKLGYDAGTRAVGLKIGTFWPRNQERGLPNHGATTVLLDPDTGFPIALIAASLLNRFRTAAANAVATDALARKSATRMAIIGTGRQAEYEVRAVAAIRNLSHVTIGARTPAHGQDLAKRLANLGVAIAVTSIDEAVGDADIITTITTAREPLFPARLVRPGTHISAMGADAKGKGELDPALLSSAAMFADDAAQSRAIGEMQHLPGAHPLTAIGAVLTGDRPGRQTEEEITIFDSSGVAAQDIEIARAVFAESARRGLTTVFDL